MKWNKEELVKPKRSNTDAFYKRQGRSERVLVFEKGEHRFGSYNHEINMWSVEGRTGLIEVTHWAYLSNPI